MRRHGRHLGVWIGIAVLLSSALVACNRNALSPEEREVRSAIQDALPDMKSFALVHVDDGPIVKGLEDAIANGDPGPLHYQLPVLTDEGKVKEIRWTSYHVDLRDLQMVEFPQSFDHAPGTPTGPSKTFQGVPDMTPTEVDQLFQSKQDPNESRMQASVLNIIGARLEGAYYGNPSRHTSSVLESIQTLLQPSMGDAEAKRLAQLTDSNYVVYLQKDFQPPVKHGETTFSGASLGTAGALRPQSHASTPINTLHPVMVADSTVYDPDTGHWLVSHWFNRVDAAANRQDAFLRFVNVGLDVPSSQSSLSTDNNRVFVRTRIAGYLALTKYGKTQLSFPSTKCTPSNSFVDNVRKLSNTYTNSANEYWMWWTEYYSGGCAYISTLGKAPQQGAVGWAGFGSGTVDSTSYVFMHESGHVIGGTHQTNAPGSPETYDSHQCKLFGFWEFGPTGPSLMSYAGGTRTYCFAVTPSDGTPKKNLTKVAEYLHSNLN